MNQQPISLEKKYRCRNGVPARVLCVDAPGPRPVISMTQEGYILRHSVGGKYRFNQSDSESDLIEVREPHVIWVNEYPDGLCDGGHFKTAEKAVAASASDLVATRKFVEVID